MNPPCYLHMNYQWHKYQPSSIYYLKSILLLFSLVSNKKINEQTFRQCCHARGVHELMTTQVLNLVLEGFVIIQMVASALSHLKMHRLSCRLHFEHVEGTLAPHHEPEQSTIVYQSGLLDPILRAINAPVGLGWQ